MFFRQVIHLRIVQVFFRVLLLHSERVFFRQVIHLRIVQVFFQSVHCFPKE